MDLEAVEAWHKLVGGPLWPAQESFGQQMTFLKCARLVPRGVLDENYPYDGVFPMTGFKDPYFKANISIYICYYRTCTQGAP